MASASRPTAYKVTFDRIGRNSVIPPLEYDADDLDSLADEVVAYAGIRLAPRVVEVKVFPESMRGRVFCEDLPAGWFSIEEVR